MSGKGLVGAGCVKHLVYGGGSLDRFGLHECINRAVGILVMKFKGVVL